MVGFNIRVYRFQSVCFVCRFVKTSPCRSATSLSFGKVRDVLAMPKQGEVNFARFVVMQNCEGLQKLNFLDFF